MSVPIPLSVPFDAHPSFHILGKDMTSSHVSSGCEKEVVFDFQKELVEYYKCPLLNLFDGSEDKISMTASHVTSSGRFRV